MTMSVRRATSGRKPPDAPDRYGHSTWRISHLRIAIEVMLPSGGKNDYVDPVAPTDSACESSDEMFENSC